MKARLKLAPSQSLINPSLDQIQKALALFANPQNKFKSIIVAGTNGKGSVCTFLELLFAKYKEDIKIAKYLSPHLCSARERIVLDQEQIPDTAFEEIMAEIDSRIDFHLTYFERLTLAAFIYFAREKVDIAILEVGLGGRWDATNTPDASQRLATVLTNIDFDHMEFLGSTIEEIRAEKEAIKRSGVPHFDGAAFASGANPNTGGGQNFRLALYVFNKLVEGDFEPEDQEDILQSFSQHYPGRFNYFQEQKLLLDGAHNPASAKVLRNFVAEHLPKSSPKFYILSFMANKDHIGFCENLFAEDFDPNGDSIAFVDLENDRAALSSELQAKVQARFPDYRIHAFPGLSQAMDFKQKNLPEDTQLVVTGSLYLIGLYLEFVGKAQ